MDAAIQAFLITVAIVGGILSPFILISFFGMINSAFKHAAVAIIAKAEETKKLPPFDDVEANLNPMTKVLSIRIIKDGKPLWQGSATQNANDDRLEFTAEETK